MRHNLNLTQILTIFDYLQNTKNPSGIIDNKDQVIWRNEASRLLMEKWYRQFPKFEIPSSVLKLQSPLALKKLKREIRQLAPIDQMPSSRYLEKEYDLLFPGIGLITVQDKFYRFLFNCQNYRIFENINSDMFRSYLNH